MLSRPLFVRPTRTLRRRALLLGPAVLLVAALGGGQLVTSTAGASPVVSADRPEHGVTRTRQNAVVRALPPARPARPAAPKRASRAARPAAPAPRATGWVRPAYGPLTSPYGWRWGRLHAGVDIGAPYGAPIYAAAAGVVTYVGGKSGYGTLVVIRHADGTETAYGHMSRYATRAGQRVSAGQVVAYVGSAGDATGPHLHFEVRIGGRAIDPLPFLRARGVAIR